MFPKSASEIEFEAKKIGEVALARSAPDNQANHVLCSLVEELAHQVATIAAESKRRRN